MVRTWDQAVPEVRRRLVVVAPHPDDEVLGAGGLMRMAGAAGCPVEVVAVTDGEASHARSQRITPSRLRTVRAAERRRALAALGVRAPVARLGLPDAGGPALEAEVAERLGAHLGPDAVVLAPWRHDGHPDHEAVGRAVAAVAAATGALLGEVEVWAKVRPPAAPPPGAVRVVLAGDHRAAKVRAARCFTSQVEALGPEPEDGPVVHPGELAALLDGTEVVRWG